MKRLLFPLLAALALPTAVHSGIPQSKNPSKWVKINKVFLIDTEDVEVKRGKLRFYMERRALDNERNDTSMTTSWTGKIRINCDKFTARVEKPNVFGSYDGGPWQGIKPDEITYDLANYYCFATGSEGYTRESEEPEWVKKIISNIEIKKVKKKAKIGKINCDSPVWKKKPICN